MPESIEERDAREREAYADEAMTKANAAWQMRFSHIVLGPTTQRGWDNVFEILAAELGPERRALDVGCGPGYYTHRVKEAGAGYVLGYDISEYYVAAAERSYGVPGQL